MSLFQPIPASAAAQIASYVTKPSTAQHELETCQAAHRINLINFWRIPLGSNILELGCGQGTCTAALAEAVGPDGSIDAVDPGSPDYGSPLTLSQAQGIISESAIGQRISWHFAEPISFLEKSPEMKWDCAVLAHCIWYFDNPDILAKILQSLVGRVKRILIAEYALEAKTDAAVPHLLATIARAAAEAHRPASTANIRCLAGPTHITEIATDAKWALATETRIVPDEGLQDGRWETSTVLTKGYTADIEQVSHLPKVGALLEGLQEAVAAATTKTGLSQVRTMDVWAAVLE